MLKTPQQGGVAAKCETGHEVMFVFERSHVALHHPAFTHKTKFFTSD